MILKSELAKLSKDIEEWDIPESKKRDLLKRVEQMFNFKEFQSIVLPNGNQYYGEATDGIASGFGIEINKKGEINQGYWENNKLI